MALKPPKRKIVIIDDVNIWITFLIGTKFTDLVDTIECPRFEFIICEEMLDELKDVIQRPKFNGIINQRQAGNLIHLIESRFTFLSINNVPQPIVRDPKDAYLINLAIQGDADILVSNDKDLTSLKGQMGKTQIMTLAEFMAYFRERKYLSNPYDKHI